MKALSIYHADNHQDLSESIKIVVIKYIKATYQVLVLNTYQL